MPRPLLITVGPDVGLSAKLVSSLRAATNAATLGQTSLVIIRQPAQQPWVGEPADQVFFPILNGLTPAFHAAIQEWVGRAVPRSMDFKGLLPQLADKQYALTVAEGVWFWYRPSESGGLAVMTAQQIAQQLLLLGKLLESI
jgi:hypothetical protein